MPSHLWLHFDLIVVFMAIFLFSDSFAWRIKTQSGHIGSRIIAITVEPRKSLLQGKVAVDFRNLKVIT